MKRVQLADRATQQFQDNAIEEFRQLKLKPFVGGVLVKGQTITTSDTYVQHGLGKAYQGYIVVDRDAAQTVYTSSTTNNRPDLELILRASGSVEVDLYVF